MVYADQNKPDMAQATFEQFAQTYLGDPSSSHPGLRGAPGTDGGDFEGALAGYRKASSAGF